MPESPAEGELPHSDLQRPIPDRITLLFVLSGTVVVTKEGLEVPAWLDAKSIKNQEKLVTSNWHMSQLNEYMKCLIDNVATADTVEALEALMQWKMKQGQFS